MPEHGARRSMAQRPIPIATAKLLYHPATDADFVAFEGASAHPFHADAAELDRTNAWWLSEAALLAYWEPDGTAENPGARARFERPGTGLEVDAFLNRRGTQCYVVSGEAFAIVTFRGTQVDKRLDLLTDIKFWTRPWSGPGRVHRGFRNALMAVWPELEAVLAQYRARGTKPRKVWFTGHSLGAALAILAAQLYDEAQGVYTIGCPCVGDRTFVAAFTAKLKGNSFRYTHGRDAVAWLPPEKLLGYEHVPAHEHIFEDGRIVDVPPGGRSAAQRSKSLWQTWRENWRKGARGVALIPWLADHTPKLYTTHIWNDLDAHG